MRPISIQRAQEVANIIASEFGAPPPPPIYVSNELSKLYAGAYYDQRKIHDPDAQFIIIRPEYVSERTVAHETGHYLNHAINPGVCKGGSPECEEIARMVEEWWMDQLKSAGIQVEDWK